MTTRAVITMRAIALTDSVNRLISGNAPLTLGQIFSALAAAGDIESTHNGYNKFLWRMAKARASGKIDSSLIREGRGRMKYKGGGAKGKFAVGSKVRINRYNGRTPAWLRREIRLNTARMVVAVVPAREQGSRSTRYYLGSNRLGNGNLDSHPFRAEELLLFVKGDVGRPRCKRRYSKENGAGKGIVPVAGDKPPGCDLVVSPSIINTDSGKIGVEKGGEI